jgi:hypothetical protein
MSSTQQSQARTRMFARVLGIYFLIIPAIITARFDTLMPVLFRAFSDDPMWQWVLGAALVMFGGIIIAFHQYWRSLAAAFVSGLGWFLMIRGIAILAFPQKYVALGNALDNNGFSLATRALFAGIALIGTYLLYVGWIKPRPEDSMAAGSTQDRAHASGH